jgi:uncharacterized protein (TIGR00730 family)
MVDDNNDGIPDDIDPDHYRVAIFGSARLKKEDKDYQDVYLLAHALAEDEIDVVTGGGPGLMEAANRGHKIGRPEGSGAHSFGLNIELPHEQDFNPFLDVKKDFDAFSRRLDAFMLLSNVVVVAPGGVGTCLEFFYAWQLMQVKHTCKTPIIMMGEMWVGLIQWIKEQPLKRGLLSEDDLSNIVVVKDWKDVHELVKKSIEVFETEGKEACLNIRMYGKKARIDDIL